MNSKYKPLTEEQLERLFKLSELTLTVDGLSSLDMYILSILVTIVKTDGWVVINPEPLWMFLQTIKDGIGRMMGRFDLDPDVCDGWEQVALYCERIADAIRVSFRRE